MKWVRCLTAILILTIASTLIYTGNAWCYDKKSEEKMGRDYAKDIEKDLTLVKDQQIIERVQRVGQTLAKIANEQVVEARYGASDIFQFKYVFKVVDEKEINAFSLPGGIIYVNSGLLELCETDDELAGVLAHEIAHASHHHISQILRKQSKVDRYIALVTIAGILGNLRGKDLNNLLFGAQMIRTGKISSCTQEAEKDADRTSVAYMVKSPYNPEGLLTFMRKLEAKHEENPTVTLGIFQTHPSPFKRVTSITKAMQDAGIKLDIRKMRDTAYAKAVPVEEGSDKYRVMICKKVVYTPASLSSGVSSKDRAEAIAKNINSALDSVISPKDIVEDAAGKCLIAKGCELIKVEPEDVALNGSDERAILSTTRTALKYATWADWLCNGCDVLKEVDKEDSN